MKNAGGAIEAFAKLLGIVRELREKCPWDREQTLGDAGKHVIEEAYEAADAIAHGKSAEVADELGDVFATLMLAAVVGEDERRFAVESMLEGAAEKLIRRHPHVYGDAKAKTATEVLDHWSEIKRKERAEKTSKDGLGGVGSALPALMRAEKLGEHTRREGMDWADAADVLKKVREELDEVERALARGDRPGAVEEIGDMLLALANAPRFLGSNAEETLRRACEKFVARFDEVARIATSRGAVLKKLSAAEVEELWQEAKRNRTK
ncbi:MAG: nucleoside triphosphate pyrophosphohydrolase [Candidatus Binataceae bacterium]